MSSDSSPSIFKLVLIPAVITLVVTVLRLVGELQGWSFAGSTEAGAPSILGIFWLIPIFGFYFGMKLARSGRGPSAAGKAALLHLGVLAAMVGWFLGAMSYFGVDMEDPSTMPGDNEMMIISVGNLLLAMLTVFAWGAAFRTNLLYALLARIPVIVVIYLDKMYEWDTHYAKFPEGSPMLSREPMEQAFGMTMAQVAMWIPATIILGGLCASLGAMLGGKKS